MGTFCNDLQDIPSRQYSLDGRRSHDRSAQFSYNMALTAECTPVSTPKDPISGFFMSTNQDNRPESICDIPEVLEALRHGELIIVVDDEQRENEGDLICASEKVTPELINFMATHGRGLICVAMQNEDLQRLGLMTMPKFGRGGTFNTAFMESVDARKGISTGISAADRAHTIQLLANPKHDAC